MNFLAFFRDLHWIDLECRYGHQVKGENLKAIDKHRTRMYQNERGSIPIILMVAFIGLAVTMHAMESGRVSAVRTLIESSQLRVAREAIISQITVNATVPGVFRASLDPSLGDVNLVLRNCILTAACDGTTEYPVSLYIPSETGQLVRFSGGSSATPALYNLDGNLCASDVQEATGACPFQVYSTFVADADHVWVHYVVTVPQNLAGSNILASLAPFDRKVKAEWPRTPIAEIKPNPFGTVLTMFTAPIIGQVDAELLAYIRAQIAVMGPFAMGNANLENIILSSGVVDRVMLYEFIHSLYQASSASAVAQMIQVWVQDRTAGGEIMQGWDLMVHENGGTLIQQNFQAVAGIGDRVAAGRIGSCVDKTSGVVSSLTTAQAEAIFAAQEGTTDQLSYALINESCISDRNVAQGFISALSGVPTSHSLIYDILKGMVVGGVTDATLALAIYQAIVDANITDAWAAKEIAMARVTDPVVATQIQAGIRQTMANEAIATTEGTNSGEVTVVGTTETSVTTATTQTSCSGAECVAITF